eukprot:PhF_6_TR37452/c0_g1_i6/m.55086
MTTTQQQIAHVELLLRNIQSMKHVDAKKEFVRTHTMTTTSLLTTPHHTDTIVIVPTPKRQDNNSATSKSSPPKSTSPFSKSSLSPNKHHQHHQHNSPPIMSTPPPYPKTTPKQQQQVQPSSPPDFSASVQSLASQIRNPDSQKELINFMKRLVDREHHHKNKANKGKPLTTLSLEVLSDSLNYIDLIEGSQIFSSELIRKIYDATVRYSKDCT